MAHIHRTALSLRFHGDDLDHGKISRTLGAQPTNGVKKGGIWTTSRGQVIVARTGSWGLRAPDESPGDLDKQLASLLSVLNNDLMPGKHWPHAIAETYSSACSSPAPTKDLASLRVQPVR